MKQFSYRNEAIGAWLIVMLLLSSCALFGNADSQTAYSPDKAYFVATRSLPDSTYIWRPDLDGFRLVVLHCKSTDELGDLYFSENVTGRKVAKLQWSPDSSFIVLTTFSSGGHSPWNSKTFVFSVADKSLRRMDDLVGPITSTDFHFEGASTVVMHVRDYAHEFGDPNDSKIVKVPLEKSFLKMKKY